MRMLRPLVTDADVAELQRCLAAAEEDRDNAQELAEERLRTIEELERELGSGREP